MNNRWVVVADSSRARFFEYQGRKEPLKELEDMIHAEGKLKTQDEVSDRQGGLSQGGHSFEPPTETKEQETVRFAQQIREKLEQGRVNNEYNELVLIAPPAFLGVLRQTLNDQISKLVIHSADKNLVAQDESSIREYL